MIEEEFISIKENLLKRESSLLDIEVMNVFGGGWRGGEQQMMVRLIYKGEKRIITTVYENNVSDKLYELIYKTRKHFRAHKLERILDGY